MSVPSPISHPSVWTGPSLEVRGGWQLSLSEEQIATLTGLVADARVDGGEHGFRGRPLEEIAITEVGLAALHPLVSQVRGELERGPGVVRLDGLPDGLDETAARTLFWVLATHFGTPVSQSAKGEKLLSVRDAGYGQDDPRSRGPNTRASLGFHTDRADVTGFMCVRSAMEGGENQIVSSPAVFNRVLEERPELVEVLMEPFYYLRHTVDEGNALPWTRQPVFSFAAGHFACCYLRVLIERAHRSSALPGLTPIQIEALDVVDAIAARPEMSFRFLQESGDMFFINNWVVLHRRDAFIDYPEPNRRRHILRVWLSMPDSRPLDPVFRDNWGSVEAGAVRGGMRPAL